MVRAGVWLRRIDVEHLLLHRLNARLRVLRLELAVIRVATSDSASDRLISIRLYKLHALLRFDSTARIVSED